MKRSNGSIFGNTIKTKLSDLIESTEFQSEDISTYFDRQTGRIVSVSREVLDLVESNDKSAMADLPDWQREEIELATAIMTDDGGRFINPPDKFDFHEYRHMEQFIGVLDNPAVADELWRAIKGRGAFRCFKDTLYRHGLEKSGFSIATIPNVSLSSNGATQTRLNMKMMSSARDSMQAAKPTFYWSNQCTIRPQL